MQQVPQARWASIFRLITNPQVVSFSPEMVTGRNVLITGAGGSIGSALAHHVSAQNPRQIVLLDASEQSLYRIDRDLTAPHTAILGSVCDRSLLNDLFERHRPQVVFHAAAFKHVPLMEFNPFAALQNNAIGTFILAQTAAMHRAEQLVMVSTDKAVEPSSIMGASKRIAELVILALQWKAVRLGNVLASEGSVLPWFQQQIDRDEPLTVTHPEASRYFLTMDHAAQLLLHALSQEFTPGILVPELGDPIRIEEIARTMLVESNPPSQSEIVFTGLRPGEKLTEKLLSEREFFLDDREAPLRRLHSDSPSLDELERAMQELEQAAQERNLSQLVRVVTKLVPDYHPGEVIQNALQHQAPVSSNR